MQKALAKANRIVTKAVDKAADDDIKTEAAAAQPTDEDPSQF